MQMPGSMMSTIEHSFRLLQAARTAEHVLLCGPTISEKTGDCFWLNARMGEIIWMFTKMIEIHI